MTVNFGPLSFQNYLYKGSCASRQDSTDGDGNIRLELGEIIAGQLAVYIANDGKAYKANLNNDVECFVIGFTQTGGNIGDTVVIQRIGSLDGFSGLVSGDDYFLDLLGTITNVLPNNSGDNRFYVGRAATATNLQIQLDFRGKV